MALTATFHRMNFFSIPLLTRMVSNTSHLAMAPDPSTWMKTRRIFIALTWGCSPPNSLERKTSGTLFLGLFPQAQPRAAAIYGCLNDPITTGLIDENEAEVLFDLIFLRLNPFVNLFDPALHCVPYVRSKCPFLFTTMIMAACKFFKHDLFKQCQKLANDLAVRAFAEAWKRVEVVQAFACLTYWKDRGDNVCLLPSTHHTIDTDDAAHLDIHWICAFTPHFPHDKLIYVYHNLGLSYGRRTGFEPPCHYSSDSRD